MFSFALGVQDVTCQRDWDKSDKALYLKLVEMAIERGVMPDLDAREPWFLCYEHTDKDIDETLQVYADTREASQSDPALREPAQTQSRGWQGAIHGNRGAKADGRGDRGPEQGVHVLLLVRAGARRIRSRS